MPVTEAIHIKINTPIPTNVSCASVLAILHDPVKMIMLNPLFESYTLIPDVTPITYSTTDKLSPTSNTTYTASFTNRANGLDTVSHAGGDLLLDGHWTVAHGVLMEEEVATGYATDLPYVRCEIEKSHPELHAGLIAEAASGGA